MHTHTLQIYEITEGKKPLTCVILKVRVKAEEEIVPEHCSATVDKAVSPGTQAEVILKSVYKELNN